MKICIQYYFEKALDFQSMDRFVTYLLDFLWVELSFAVTCCDVVRFFIFTYSFAFLGFSFVVF